MVLAGHSPSDVVPIFFGGCLLALNKKSGGIRPIAIGFTLGRLALKFGTNQLKSLFHPCHLGVGIPGRCRGTFHFAHRSLEAMPANYMMVKLDFTNAFNNLHRHDMLLAVPS